MSIFLSGTASIVGSNWMAQSDKFSLNPEKMSYSGNCDDLTGLTGDPPYFFLRGVFADVTQR